MRDACVTRDQDRGAIADIIANQRSTLGSVASRVLNSRPATATASSRQYCNSALFLCVVRQALKAPCSRPGVGRPTRAGGIDIYGWWWMVRR